MAIIKNPLTIVQSGGGSVELGTYNKIGQPFVAGEVCEKLVFNKALTLNEALNVFQNLPYQEIDGMQGYIVAMFTDNVPLGVIKIGTQYIMFIQDFYSGAFLGVTPTELHWAGVAEANNEFFIGVPVLNVNTDNSIYKIISNGDFSAGIFIPNRMLNGQYSEINENYNWFTGINDTINENKKTIITSVTAPTVKNYLILESNMIQGQQFEIKTSGSFDFSDLPQSGLYYRMSKAATDEDTFTKIIVTQVFLTFKATLFYNDGTSEEVNLGESTIASQLPYTYNITKPCRYIKLYSID